MGIEKGDLSLGKINQAGTENLNSEMLGFFMSDCLFACYCEVESNHTMVFFPGKEEAECCTLDRLCGIIREKVHPQDIKKVLALLENEHFEKLLDGRKSVSEYFRWKSENGYSYQKLEIKKSEAEAERPKKVFIFASCVDEEMKRVLEHDEMLKRYESGIYALSREYTSVYYVNLDTCELIPYNISNRIESMFGDKFYRMNYEDAVKTYIDKGVIDEQKEMMSELLSTEYIKKQIERQSVFVRVYLNNENRYTTMKCVRIDNPERDNIVVMGFAVCDEEFRENMEKKKRDEVYMSLLDGLSREYDSVWLIHSDRTMELFRASSRIPDMKAVRLGVSNPVYDEAVKHFTMSMVNTEDKESMIKAVSFDTLLEKVPEEGVYNVTFKYDRGNNTFGYHQACFARAVGLNGDLNFVMGFRDVDTVIREQLVREERYMSAIMQRDMDGLTGINNRYCYEQRIETYPDSEHERIGCIYIDVNGLHELNNINGHEAGDELIRFVADCISNIWGRDNCFRIGGDEFVAFSFDCPDSVIKQDVIRLREEIMKAGYSASVGSGSAQVKGLSMRQLIKSAERSMYADKRKYYSGVMDRRTVQRSTLEEV